MFSSRLILAGSVALGLLIKTHLAAGDGVVTHPSGPPSLEELGAIEVTSVSRKQQRLRDTAAAVFVITSDDIRRSGARNIPEVLRMVPGLHVARINSNNWAISSRGFNGRFANKMLVLVDGRSVYNTLFSGVFWDMQDTLLEDVERIEVIRGPGATMWGANAVNGVISIITKDSRDTQGSYAAVTYGTEGQKGTQVRHGGAIGRSAHYRAFGKIDGYESLRGLNDSWSSRRGGIRVDIARGSNESIELQSNFVNVGVSASAVVPSLTAPYQSTLMLRSGNANVSAQGRWQRSRGDTQETTVQFYVDHVSRTEILGRGSTEQFNIEVERRRSLGMHEVTGGLGYRRNLEQLSNAGIAKFNALNFGHNLYSGFVQDQIGTDEDPFTLVLGAKLEHNVYTGAEFQPRIQGTVQLGGQQMSWFSLARAVRTPSRYENSVDMDGGFMPGPGLPIAVRVLGSPGAGAEELIAAEAGYRQQPSRKITLDFAGFYNRYRHLSSAEPEPARLSVIDFMPVILQDLRLRNMLSGATMGIEALMRYDAMSAWHLTGSVSHLQTRIWRNPGSQDMYMSRYMGNGPRHKAEMRSYLDLSRGLELDAFAYYVSAVRGTNIPGYARVDMRLGLRAGARMEFSVHVENLLNHRHIESHPEIFGEGSVIGRSIRSTVTWRF